MSLWRSRPNREPAAVPRGAVMVETAEMVVVELMARTAEAARIIELALSVESVRARRTGDLGDACLDALSVLKPSAPDPADLREMPPLPLRYAVLVIPGRAS